VAFQDFPSRALHDVGLSAWFGGTLANAVSLNRAAGATDRYSEAGKVTNTGWNLWAPVNAGAIGAHLVGAVGQLIGNKERLASQKGVASMSVLKTALTAAALGASGYSRILGRTIAQQHDVPHERGRVIEVHLPDGSEINVDGEIRTGGLERVTVEPRAFRLVVR
jgi:hypothetical protein